MDNKPLTIEHFLLWNVLKTKIKIQQLHIYKWDIKTWTGLHTEHIHTRHIPLSSMTPPWILNRSFRTNKLVCSISIYDYNIVVVVISQYFINTTGTCTFNIPKTSLLLFVHSVFFSLTFVVRIYNFFFNVFKKIYTLYTL